MYYYIFKPLSESEHISASHADTPQLPLMNLSVYKDCGDMKFSCFLVVNGLVPGLAILVSFGIGSVIYLLDIFSGILYRA